MTATALAFAMAAESLLGAPFRHRGRSTAGIDCIGLTFVAAERVGNTIKPFIDYEPQPDPEVLLAAVRERCDEVGWAERLLPGRLVILRQRMGGLPKHFAVTLGDGWAAHVSAKRSVRAKINDQFVHSVWRVRGIDYEGQ